MAERNYTITLELSNVEGKSPVAGDNSKSDTEKAKEVPLLKTVLASAAYQKAKNVAVSFINAEVSRVQLRTGSNELQLRANIINSTVQKTAGFIESVAIGAGTGGWVGAVVGAVTSVASMGIDYMQKTQTLSLEKNLENETIRQNLIRAGAGGSRRNE